MSSEIDEEWSNFFFGGYVALYVDMGQGTARRLDNPPSHYSGTPSA